MVDMNRLTRTTVTRADGVVEINRFHFDKMRDHIETVEAENERLRYHLEGTLETLLDAEVCSTDCVHCNEARAALGEKQ